jgi:DNA-binding response OmpR family regulator
LLARRAARSGNTLHLTVRRSFDLLEYLLRHVGSVVSRDMLARDVEG